MTRVTELIVRFDNGHELVVDDIGPNVTPYMLAFDMVAAVYRIQAGETERFEGEGTYVHNWTELLEDGDDDLWSADAVLAELEKIDAYPRPEDN